MRTGVVNCMSGWFRLWQLCNTRRAGGCVLAVAGYGMFATFRQGLSERGLALAVGIPLRQLVARFAAVRVRVADGPPQRIGDMGTQYLPK